MLPTEDKAEALRNYDENQIDAEFLPYIKRINQLDSAISCQCCTGHMEFSEGQWGYISLYVAPQMIPFFDDKPSWLLECRSKTWFENTIEPTLTPYGSVMIVFAWKAEHWPIPAIEITNTLEKGKI